MLFFPRPFQGGVVGWWGGGEAMGGGGGKWPHTVGESGWGD